ncbi:MAG: hypothetical protein GXP10_06025 [Gammaproteobacteria bacterium]|nr:hypothetical protein [Gammaproteobacteria bacterium]
MLWVGRQASGSFVFACNAVNERALIEALRSGATLLTVNRRLAAYLRDRFDRQRMAAGERLWPSADILPLNAWLERCWHEQTAASVDAPRLLLSLTQEQVLWEQVIAADDDHATALLQIPATAARVREAWLLSREWCLNLCAESALSEALSGTLSEEVKAFLRWSAHYSKRCREARWLDHSELPDAVAALFEQGALKPPPAIYLVGMGSLSPQLKQLFDGLTAVQCPVDVFQLPPRQGRAVRSAFADSTAEIDAAARWARYLLEHFECYDDGHAATSNLPPVAPRIGIVVPDLGNLRSQIERIFRRVLATRTSADLPSGHATLFNISLGQSLSQQPMIHTALTLLELLSTPRIALDTLGHLLRSPFIGEADGEMSARALFDGWLRERGQLHYSLAEIAYFVSGRGAWRGETGRFAARLDALLRNVVTYPKTAPLVEWIACFSQTLSTLGWPGERSLNSPEFQCFTAWKALLVQYAQTASVLSSERVSAAAALSGLRRLATKTLFQAQTVGDVPVQVLGVLEAAGQQFDHLWLMGVHDEIWPTAPRANPFLPLTLQRQQGMPHSSAAHELAFAEQLTQQLLGDADRVVVGYPLSEGDRELRPSPLISALSEVDGRQLECSDVMDYTELIQAAARTERYDDQQAPPLRSGEAVRGGTALFKHQAACPFRAFAKVRLAATALADPQPGLNAMERGTLLHSALEQFWNDVSSSEQLHALDETALDERVQRVVSVAIEKMVRHTPKRFSPRFLALEQQRMSDLLQRWLLLEKARPAFNVIATEQRKTVCVAGMELRTQIDRIDELSSGAQVVIDYKSGESKVAHWFGERPEEPQLPCYGAFAQEGDSGGTSMAGLLFAQLKANDLKFKGLTEEDEAISGVNAFSAAKLTQPFSSWDALTANWRRVLTELAEAFRDGCAEVDPKVPVETCKYCDFKPLCRIHEHSVMIDSSDSKDSSDE